jgi:integrase
MSGAIDLPNKEQTRLCFNKIGVWEIRWTDRGPDGRPRTRRHSCSTTDRREAEAYRDAWLSAGHVLAARAGAKTVEDLCGVYLDLHVRAQGKSDAQHWALLPVRRLLGDKTLMDLNVMEFRRYHNERRGEGVSDGKVRRELGALAACLKWCVDNEVLDRATVVLPKIPMPAEGKPRTRTLDEKDVERVWKAAVGRVTACALQRQGVTRALPQGMRSDAWRIGLFVCLALETAARAKAIEGLTWDRVDFVGRVIDYRDPGLRDTKKRRVVVPMSDRLRDVLVVARTHLSGGVCVLDHKGSVRTSYENFMDGLGIDATRHDLRRTWATLRARWGVSLFDIAGVLGDRVETVTKHYAHFSPDHLRTAVDARGPVGPGAGGVNRGE